MNKENSHFCWSCGKPLTDCHCEEGPQPINQKKPKQTLPICQLSPDYEELKYLLKFAKTEQKNHKVLHTCCKCGQAWLCSQIEYVWGTCPHCGANGIEGKKE